MSDLKDLLERLDEAHVEEQRFRLETFGKRDFDPGESTLHSEAAEAIRKLMEPAMEYAVECTNTYNGLKHIMNKEPITSLLDAQKYRDFQLRTDKILGSNRCTYRIVTRPMPENYKEVTD